MAFTCQQKNAGSSGFDLALGTLGALLAGLMPLTTLTELINMGTLLAFTVIAIPVLRKTRPDLPRVFVCPGSLILPIASVMISLLLMFSLTLKTRAAFGIWLLLGLVVYFGYSRRHSRLNDEALSDKSAAVIQQRFLGATKRI